MNLKSLKSGDSKNPKFANAILIWSNFVTLSEEMSGLQGGDPKFMYGCKRRDHGMRDLGLTGTARI